MHVYAVGIGFQLWRWCKGVKSALRVGLWGTLSQDRREEPSPSFHRAY